MFDNLSFRERRIVGVYLDNQKDGTLNIISKNDALNRAFLCALHAQSSIAFGRLKQAFEYLDASIVLFDIAMHSKIKKFALSQIMPTEFTIVANLFKLHWMKSNIIDITLLDNILLMLNVKYEEELKKNKSVKLSAVKYMLAIRLVWKEDFKQALEFLEVVNHKTYKKKSTPFERAEFDPSVLLELTLRYLTGIDTDFDYVKNNFVKFFNNRGRILKKEDTYPSSESIEVCYLYYKYIKKVTVDSFLVIQSTEWGELEESISRDHIEVQDPICYV